MSVAESRPSATTGTPRTVGIVGGGSAALIAALALARSAHGLTVTCIESPRIPVIGVGESTTPTFVRFLHEVVGIPRADLFREVAPTWKLGIQFLWGRRARGFPFPFQGDDLLDAWVHDGGPERQSRAARWMAEGRGPVVRDASGRDRLVADTALAYHLDNRALLTFLRERCAPDVRFERATIAAAPRDATGRIARLLTDDGREFRFDLYVDCSGFRSLLLGDALGVPFVPYERALVTDRALHGRVRRAATGPAYTEARTMPSGWRWSIPIRREDHIGYVFSSRFADDAEAEADLRALCPAIEDLALVRFRSGRHRDFVASNVVALGNAYAFVEPLESTALHMLAVQLELLLAAWPFGPGTERARELVNGEAAAEWDAIRDLLAVHYRFNERLDTPFWRWARSSTELGEAASLVAHFEERGPLSARPDRAALERSVRVPRGFGLFAYDTLLLGQGVPTHLVAPRLDRQAWNAAAAARELEVQGALPHDAALEAYDAELAIVRGAPAPRPGAPTAAHDGASVGQALFVELHAGTERLTLRLFRDEDRTQRAFAHGGGYGVEHLERLVPPGCRRALVGAGKALSLLAEEPAWSPRLLDVLRAVVERHAPGTGLVVRRALASDQPIPRWPASLRSGGPERGATWPFDAELAALGIGARRLIRREWSTGQDEARERDAAGLAARGLHLHLHPRPDGRLIVLAAPESEVLGAAIEHERRVETDAPGWEASAQAMGAALGYPSCCVNAFVGARARTDGTLLALMLPEPRHPAQPPEMLWLNGALTLFSHAPCSAGCAPTRALARRVLAALEHAHPGFERGWHALAARLHLLTSDGRMMAAAAEGSLEGGTLHASDIIEFTAARGRVELTRPFGDRTIELRLEGLWLRAQGEPRLAATLFADHRAPR